ncbi:ABC transporter substrate-binding protein [Rhodovulum sulfidophilum]|uniref:ABC transporter substrate-binding protein n=1 Tax=Rhodovulum sulfidophilum TaxID=35806 RepID=A0ABS1RT41_RHOSU|nr:ABC transporter substrate-binding protein [Rhodovulum sulfidophilum]MBL3594077.1 ABC transporter substrate-binding protein [Rhodovulum sulfidophilum]MBL3608154.1 ABC transporter substrate-binding protein [Rhodovulum sulfidophilum]MCE8456717.1 ABC transporter substrate-binding protein [Rhodovulum sulfidophilum]
MKKLLLASAATLGCAGGANAEDIKIGVLLGFTGPIESMSVAMGAGADLAIKEVNESGRLLAGDTVVAVRGDATCIDSSAATAAAERMITSDGVKGIMGAACSGVTGAVLQNVARPNGMVMISPSATSPALSDVEDDGLFFRTAPSDARQGQVMANILKDDGVDSVALTYTNNDYGKGLANSFETAFTAAGGTVTISAAHEDDKGDYSAEVGALAAAGGDLLLVAGYADRGGAGILRSALDLGAFDRFHFPDGMVSDATTDAFGDEIDGSTGQLPGNDTPGAEKYAEIVDGAFDSTAIFSGESYDATALILLAMQAAGSTDPQVYKDKIMDVANAPGEEIYPGELDKALQILADGGDIDYVGATALEFIDGGESRGNYRVVKVEDGKFVATGYR